MLLGDLRAVAVVVGTGCSADRLVRVLAAPGRMRRRSARSSGGVRACHDGWDVI